MAEREKGVATVPCPTCGADLPVVEQADGSVAGQTCPQCYPSEGSEKASADQTAPAREQGTPVDTQEK